MAPSKRAALLAAVIFTFFTSRYAPQLVIYSSFFWNTATLFLIELVSSLIWGSIVYPLCLSPLRHLPSPPDGNIFLGHFKRIFKEPTGEPQRDWIDNVSNEGVLYYRWLFNEPRVLVTTPKALAEVLVQRNYEFIKPQRLRIGLGRILGVGILLAEGDEHKRQRRTLMPAFSFRHVKDLYPGFWSKSREMVEAISGSLKTSSTNVIEVRDWASRATLDIIGTAGMGQDFGALADPENELYQTYRRIFGGHQQKAAQLMMLGLSFLPAWLVKILPLKRNNEIAEAISTIKSVAANLIATKRSKLEKSGGKRTDTDILSVAIESGGFSDDDLVNQLMTFLAAGHETTASAMAWAIYLLCKNPEVQTRLREEVHAALPSISDSNFQITSMEIDHVAYLNAVINETFRVFPPVPLTLRETEQDTTIQGKFIPKETTVVICPWAVNTSKALWGDDARDFNPDRWMGPGRANNGGAESNFATVTFLHGPRSCIGKDFAKAEFACLLAAFVGRFEFELDDPNWKLDIQGGITARPKGGLFIKVKEVDGW